MDRHQEFLELFLRHQHDLRAFVASVVRDWHRSEDILQEVSAVLWRKFDDYDRARSFGAWAHGIAGNMILKDLERHRRTLPLLTPEAIEAVMSAYEHDQPEPSVEQEALRRCMRQLSDHARRIVALRYEQSLSLQELADQADSTLAAVKKALSRIRAHLHACVSSQLGITLTLTKDDPV
jgi:RNA polymerase sigma-70 factor, ECF subfamily